jgi:hypothetical protein
MSYEDVVGGQRVRVGLLTTAVVRDFTCFRDIRFYRTGTTTPVRGTRRQALRALRRLRVSHSGLTCCDAQAFEFNFMPAKAEVMYSHNKGATQ